METMIAGCPVTIDGEGESLLFLPGFLCDRQIFANQISYFSRFKKVFAPSLPGFGEVKATHPLCLDDYVAVVSEIINELNSNECACGKIDVVAHSFGARIIIKLLPDERINKVVITSGAGLKPKASLKKSVKIALHKIKRRLHINTEGDGSEDYRRLDDIMKKTFVSVVNEHLDGRLKTIDNEILLLWGKDDKETPLYMAKKFEKGLKNARLSVVENAGHFVFLDKPSVFNFLVKDFLS